MIVPQRHRHLRDAAAPVLQVDDSVIYTPVSLCVVLMLLFDEHMTMEPHLNVTTRAAYGHLRSLSRIRRYLDNRTCTDAIGALVWSWLDFANALLANLPGNNVRRLQLVQNNAARPGTKTPGSDHITPALKTSPLAYTSAHLSLSDDFVF